MSHKVAVASSDGKVVNRHFGHADKFLIFEVDEKTFCFLEVRETVPYCQNQSHGASSAALDALADCKAVLVSRIGPGAREELKSRGVESWVITDFIESALMQYVQRH
ncbi:dinitrogenase iron-molybdenum cofactor biosynthesis protein [Heliobacillus mobilis]|uniref:Dinitrogenase iron-molybdenum cofactor biosynthesis protein n=1 Tax=Heliobacterium mobile TaxID=28064 RepID=A0A6I3SHC9_HELMO|nr:NifB/NifX family molybdenum-iron cluster-binding protein [Heliobacterium mobile]MTV48250.1 dinitrogenase iron-molybdenum cofactor biosynthesis protein [Heliobacterium mobile]